MEELLAQIEQADDIQISRIIRAVIRRYSSVSPEHEVVFLSLPTNDPEERQLVLCNAMMMFGMTEDRKTRRESAMFLTETLYKLTGRSF